LLNAGLILPERGVLGDCWSAARWWLTRSRRRRFKLFVTALPDLSQLSHAEKDALILAHLPIIIAMMDGIC